MSIGFVLGMLLLLLVGVLVVRRRPVSAIAETGRQLVAGVPPTPAAVALLERWRNRARRWRSTLAVPTVLCTLGASVVLRGSIDVGIGAHPAWADPLLTGLLSVFLGAIAAELHHLRHRTEGPRVADLTPRDVSTHLPPGARRRLVGLAVVASIATLLAGTVGERRLPVLGVLALIVVVLVPVVQRGIVVRGRPAVTADLRIADDAVRTLAVRSVDEAGAGAVLLLAAWQLASTYAAVEAPLAVTVLLVVGQFAAVVSAVVWWRRSSPQRLLPDVSAALRATDPAHLRSPR